MQPNRLQGTDTSEQRKVNKMKSKITRFSACVLTVLAVATAQYLPVFAAEDSTTKASDQTKVKYNITEGYTWTVTPEITFTNDNTDADDSKEGTITVSKNIIAYGKKLQISVKSDETDNSFKIANNDEKLTYTIKKDNTEIQSGGVALDVPAGTSSMTQNLTFTLSAAQKKAAKYAGEYSGTATFTAAVVDAAN